MERGLPCHISSVDVARRISAQGCRCNSAKHNCSCFLNDFNLGEFFLHSIFHHTKDPLKNATYCSGNRFPEKAGTAVAAVARCCRDPEHFLNLRVVLCLLNLSVFLGVGERGRKTEKGQNCLFLPNAWRAVALPQQAYLCWIKGLSCKNTK